MFSNDSKFVSAHLTLKQRFNPCSVDGASLCFLCLKSYFYMCRIFSVFHIYHIVGFFIEWIWHVILQIFYNFRSFSTFTTLWGSFSSSRKGFYLFCFLFCDCVRNCLIYLILKFTQSLSLRRASYDSVIEKPQKELHEMQAFHYVRGFPHITASYGKCSQDFWGIFSEKI